MLGAAVAALGSLLGLARLGLRVPPAPFAAFSGAPPAAGGGSVPIPADVPPPVLRNYRTVFAGGAVPVVDSAVLSGRGRLAVGGLTFPIRWRFVHQAGRAYRHRIEATWAGLPVFRVAERYLDGRLRMATRGGELAGDSVADRAVNFALRAESLQALPSVLVTDARVRWEPIDDARARLVVPFGRALAGVFFLGGALVVVPAVLEAAWVATIVSALAAGATPDRVERPDHPLDPVVAFPAMFWGGIWRWRRQTLGYLVAALHLVKGGFLGLTLAVSTWLATAFWGPMSDPAVPVYTLGGVVYAVLAGLDLRRVDDTAGGPAGRRGTRQEPEGVLP